MNIKTYQLKKNSISYIYSIKDKIEIAPDYQRQGELWNSYKKQLFLDSIFNGYDIPKMYLHVLQNPRLIRNRTILYSVIDGRQRLETIWEFLENKFPLIDFKIEYGNTVTALHEMKYQDIAKNYPSIRTFFDSYELPIIGVETENDEEDLIEDMFSRLNEAVSINAAEKRNAMGGNMVKLIRRIASHPFFKNRVRISNKRYQHYEVAARLLFLENSIRKKEIVDTKKAFLDDFVKEYKTRPPRQETKEKVKEILDTMSRTFFSNDKLLQSQARIPIYYLLFREAKTQGRLRNITRQKILTFTKKVEDNKRQAQTSLRLAKPDLLEYDRLTIQGTNDSSSIRTRFHIISRHFDIDSSSIDQL